METEGNKDFAVYRIFGSYTIGEEADLSRPMAVFKGKKEAIDYAIYLSESSANKIYIDEFSLYDDDDHRDVWMDQFVQEFSVTDRGF